MKINIQDEYRLLRRVVIFALIGFLIFFILLLRLFYMQVIQGEKYQNLAEKNRISVRFMTPERGKILGKDNAILSYNQKEYRLILIPRNTKNIDKTLEIISNISPIADHDMIRIKQTYQKLGKRSTTPIVIQRQLNLETIFKLELALDPDTGCEVSQAYSRKYPLKEAGAHVLGYIGAISQKHENYQNFLKLGRVGIGKTGLEVMQESKLFGSPGTEEVEVNAAGQLIRVLSKTHATQGKDLLTTLDLNLQRFVYDLLSPYKSGCAIVMNTQTGEILAMASYPGFDPHAFEDGILEQDWKTLLTSPYKPLTNKTTSGLYAPGSAFKMVVALSALEMGIDPNATSTCNGGLHVGNHIFHCHKNWGHGEMNMKSAIRESCDVYFYELSQKIGIERISKTAKELGFGEKTSLDFPSEKQGLLPNKAWKESHKKESWKVFDTILSSIGQGYILSTPMQLAQMTSRLATGKMIVPHVVKQENVSFSDLNINQKNLIVIRESMEAVMNHYLGTGYASRLEESPYAGKTGTSQVRRISMKDRLSGAYRTQEKAWNEKDHALFVGYGPLVNPQYTVVVVIEHGGSGSRTAAPIAKSIFERILHKQKIDEIITTP